MATPTMAQRKAMPASEMGLPSQNKYPMDTRGRAANAKSRASQQKAKGNLSDSEYNAIIAKANKILGKGKSKKGGNTAKRLDDALDSRLGEPDGGA